PVVTTIHCHGAATGCAPGAGWQAPTAGFALGSRPVFTHPAANTGSGARKPPPAPSIGVVPAGLPTYKAIGAPHGVSFNPTGFGNNRMAGRSGRLFGTGNNNRNGSLFRKIAPLPGLVTVQSLTETATFAGGGIN